MEEHISEILQAESGDQPRAFTHRLGRLEQEGWLVAVIPPKVEERLRGTCFRGYGIQLAGNFCRWQEPRLLFRELGRLLNERLQPMLSDALQANPAMQKCDVRVELEYSHRVGWSSTDDVANYPEGIEFEPFNPNPHTEAIRMPLSAGYLAPLTRLVTFSGELYAPRTGQGRSPNWQFCIFSIYPGPDIGRLRREVSAQQGVVFFQWEHPGEPL